MLRRAAVREHRLANPNPNPNPNPSPNPNPNPSLTLSSPHLTGPRFYVSLTAAALHLYAISGAEAEADTAESPPMPRALREAIWKHADERCGTQTLTLALTLTLNP